VRLASGVREYFSEQPGKALEMFQQVRGSPEGTIQARMWLAVLARDKGKFLDALARMLDWHAREALRTKENRSAPEFYICMTALGLSAHAVRKGIAMWEDLPEGNVYLPLELARLCGGV
jgi:hypothetical protein